MTGGGASKVENGDVPGWRGHFESALPLPPKRPTLWPGLEQRRDGQMAAVGECDIPGGCGHDNREPDRCFCPLGERSPRFRFLLITPWQRGRLPERRARAVVAGRRRRRKYAGELWVVSAVVADDLGTRVTCELLPSTSGA